MESLMLKMWLWFTVALVFQMNGNQSCLEGERKALLEIKVFFQSISSYDSDQILPSWVDDDDHNKSDCCGWEMLKCNATTGRVVELSPNATRRSCYSDEHHPNMNASLFHVFEELQALNLSGHCLGGIGSDDKGESNFGSLKNLKTLDLGYNYFNETIFSHLADLTSLTTLTLKENDIRRITSKNRLANLKTLRVLDLSYNYLNTSLFESGYDTFQNLKQLKVLNLDRNYYLDGSIFTYLAPLTSLTTLTLSGNEMESIPLEHGYDTFQNLKQLKVLNLDGNHLDGSIFTYLAPLTSLTTLTLRGNNIESIPLKHGESNFGSLKNLKTLDLGYNHLNETIFSHLADLTSLTTLILQSNGIERITSKNRLANLETLRVLDLSYNRLNTSLFEPGYDTFQNLKQLKVLNLDTNDLDGSIFAHLAPLTSLTTLILSWNEIESIPLEHGLAQLKSLETLDLSQNQINNTLSQLEICELKNLIWLDLSGNNIYGLLPDCLSNLTKLRGLGFSRNQLSGNLTFPFPKLTSLEFLGLYGNNFGGSFSLRSFANSSKLVVLEISSRNDEFEVVVENFPWIPAFQLRSLTLINCNLKGPIPSFLMSQYNLHHVDLSHNELVGPFPLWLLQNNTNLEGLHLRDNSFSGTWQLLDSKHGLEYLDISRNGFSGHIPMDIGMILPSLVVLNMSRNRFQGNNTPPSMGEMKILTSLDLSTNEFSGELLKYIITDCTSLQSLDLSNNRLYGQIFPEYANLTQLRWLFLNDNHFHGNIGSGLLNSIQLEIIDISNNNISGHVPQWMGNFSCLRALLMSRNLLGGTFPAQIMNNLRNPYSLDISENKFFGPMTSFNVSSMRFLYMQKNDLTGPIPKALFKSTELLILDLSDNRFSGGIQPIISDHSSIRILILGGNQLQGQIPHQLCKLRDLHIMDLSRNKINGSIPSCFGDLQYWSTQDLHDEDSNYDISRVASRNYMLIGDYNDKIFGGRFGLDIARQFEAKIITKNRYDSYKGKNLKYMTLLDLSSNKLTGKIPKKFGDLRKVHALNLSHNCLSGSIPKSFSNLHNAESLDLSQNKLSGIIPSQLSELTFLEIFNVSYNNFSGPTPNGGQFANFDESNYKGNPNLCGPAVNKSCFDESINKSYARELPIEDDDESAFVDMLIFYWSFGASFVTMIFGVLLILLLNSHWRSLWFGFVDACIYSCFGWLFRYLYYQRLYRP